jgi:hypothetical protein
MVEFLIATHPRTKIKSEKKFDDRKIQCKKGSNSAKVTDNVHRPKNVRSVNWPSSEINDPDS